MRSCTRGLSGFLLISSILARCLLLSHLFFFANLIIDAGSYSTRRFFWFRFFTMPAPEWSSVLLSRSSFFLAGFLSVAVGVSTCDWLSVFFFFVSSSLLTSTGGVASRGVLIWKSFVRADDTVSRSASGLGFLLLRLERNLGMNSGFLV